jgi:PAS domain S-box-containing protein
VCKVRESVLLFSILAVALSLTIGALFSLRELGRTADQMMTATRSSLAEASGTERLFLARERAARALRAYLLFPRNDRLELLGAARGEFEEEMARLISRDLTPDNARKLLAVEALYRQIERSADDLIAARRSGASLEALRPRFEEGFDPLAEQLDMAVAELDQVLRAEVERSARRTEALAARSIRIVSSGMAVGTLALLALLSALGLTVRSRQRALGASERAAAELRATLESLPDAVFLVGASGRLRAANAQAMAVLGIERMEEAPKSLQELLERLRPLSAESTEPLPGGEIGLGQALTGERVVQEVTFCALGEERHRSFRTAAAPIYLDGRLLGAVAVATETTELRARERQLRTSEARFAAIVDIALQAIISVDHAHRITLFNQGAETIFGYRAFEVLGQSVHRLLPERYRAAHQGHLRAFGEGPETARGMAVDRVVVGLRKSGEEFPAVAAVSKLVVDGEITMNVVLRDVTQEKRAARELGLLSNASALLVQSLEVEESLSRLTELVASELADGVAILASVDGEVRLRACAHREDEAIASFREALALIQGPADSHPLRALAPQLAVGDTLAKLSQRGGVLAQLAALGPSSLLVVPLQVSHGWLGAMVLLTGRERPPLDARATELCAELASRIAFAIENARLFEATRRAVRMRDDTMGVVAHDLRNPLSALALAAKTLRRRWLPATSQPEAVRLVDAMIASSHRMDRLIQDLLDVARFEAGKLLPQLAPRAPSELVEEARGANQDLAADAQLELNAEVEEGLPEVQVDAERLARVFGNIIGNAVKFTPPGGQVAVGARREARAVRFFVRDDGPGIPAEVHEHLFERFWQGRPTDRRGAGLGLSIAKAIVEAHGGQIWVESVPGRETTVSFRIPWVPPEGQ